MDKKSSMSRIERQKREKVLRFSIRKYSFGAASVAVAALMFLGARVVSADSVTPVDQPHVEALTQDTSPLASQDKEEPTSSVKVDTATASQLVAQIKDQLHIKETAKTDLLVTANEELVKAEQTLADSKVSQEEVDALVARLTNVLDQLRAVETPPVKEDKNGESTQEATPEIKPEVVKPTSEISAKSEETSENTNAEQLEKAKANLKLSIDRLEQTIAQTPENDLTREILEKAIAQVAVAKSAFGGVEVSLRDVEDMNRVIKRNESSVMIARNRLTSGSHDPRNGQSMGQGTGFRANGQINQGALTNIKYFASVDPKENGGRDTINDNPELTRSKTDIKATYVQDSEGKWIVYDVFFNNDGKRMTKLSYQQQYYFQAPFNIMHSSNTVKDLSFTRYRLDDENSGKKLSDGFTGFTPYGNTAYIPTSKVWEQNYNLFNGDKRTIYDPYSGVTRDNQRWAVFKNNEKDPVLNTLTKNKKGDYPGASYYLGIKTGQESADYATHMHAKIRLRDDVTAEEAAQYGRVYAASVTYGRTTNQSYIMGAMGTSLQADPEAPKDPIQGLTVTKTVGDNAGDPINPVSSGYVKHKKGGEFPAGMNWTWQDNNSPSTAQAGVFKYTSIATYKDGSKSTDANSGSDGTVTLNVKPKQPTITTSVENKKGLTNQQITVNVGSGVPNGSTVKLYDGDTVIGTGTTNGETATVTVSGALPGNPITAETVVNNGGTVTSDRSNPVTPTEVPDNQPPKIYWLKDDGSRQELGYTHAAGQNVVIPLYRGDAVNTRLITIDDSGKVTDFRLENLQSGFSFTPVNGTATEESPLGQNVTGKVGLEVKKGKYTARAISTDGTNSTTGYFVFEIHEQAEKYPLEGKTETVTVGDSLKTWKGRVDSNQYTEAPKGRGVGVEWGWKGEAPKVVQDTAGVFKYTATATHPDKSVAESNPQVTIIVKPKAPTIETDLTGKAEVPNTEVVVNVHDGVKDGSIVTLYSTEGRAIGTGTVTNGKAKITGTIPVGNITAKTTVQTPGQPNVESELSPIKVATKIAETEKPGKIEIDRKPNGDAIVTPKKPDGTTYPSGSKVEIPGENGTTIPVTIGDNGSGEVPNDKLPKTDAPGKGTVTEPNKKPSQPVDVTTPARKTPTVDVEQDPKTGDVTVTPKKPDGTTYPPGTKVEIPGKDKDHPITVTIGEDGKGKVPNSELPEGKVPGTGKITEPGKSTEEVPVETPAHKTPTLDVEQDPKTGDVTVTPKRPDGSTYPPGTTVEIPGKDKDHPITVTIGEDGKGKVPNSDLPEGDVPGTGKITEPGKPAVEVPVTTPGKVTPNTPTTETPSEIEITPQPNGDAIVTPKKPDGKPYPPGTTVEIPSENGTPITVEIGKDGSGKVPNDKLPKKDVPGTGTVTEPNKKPSQPVNVTTPARKTPTIELKPDPKTGDVTVTPQRPGGGTYPPGTKVEIPGEDGPITVTIGEDGKGKVPNDNLPKKDVPGTGKIIEPGKPAVEVPVETPAKVTPNTPRTEKPGKIEITRKPNGDAIVTPKKPDGSTYPSGSKVVIPGENNTPIEVTIGDNGSGEVPNDKLPKTDVPGTGKVTEPNKKPSQPVDVTTPARKTPTLELDQDPKTGDVTVTPKKPDGSTFPPGTKVEIPGKDGNPITVTIGEDGKGKVPNSDLPEGDVPGTGKITEPGKPAVEVPVETPAKVIPNTPRTEKPGKIEITRKPNGDAIVTPKKPDGSTYPSGSKVVIPGENNTPIEVTIGDNGSGEVPNDKLPKKDVPGTGKVTEPNKKPSQPVDVTTPARKTPTIELDQDPKTGDVTVTPKKPDGSTFPPGTKVEIPGKDGNPITVTIGEDGKGKVPNSDLPEGDVPGTGKITEPGKPAVEVPVETPAKVIPNTPRTEKPGEIEITRKPNGDAIVTPKKPGGGTYPPGTKVVIPGENNTPIEVTIGDNGSGEVPNDKLPKKDVPGTGKVTEPNKKPSQPVDVTTPARKTPTLDVDQDPKTGDVTVTPKKPDGSTFPPGTKVEIPGKDGNPIIVTIGEDGKGKVPNSDLPEGDVPGTGKITEPGKPAVEVPVETPAKVIPNTPRTEKPGKIEITRKPNGDAIVTPKKPGGGTYPPGTKVVIPGENNTPIEVTIGDNGSGEVPNDKLPKKDVPGTGKVTEPNKKPSQPVDVTTPARKTPTLELDQDPKTGDVTVTPKKPDGSTFPPGTKVEIPGKDGNPITVTIGEDGKGKVPNSDLPEGDVPGTGKITEPGKPAVEVPVETPAKVIPNTPRTEKPGKIEITRKPNGDAIVTPKKPDGSTYPSGSKVVIPGENNTPIEVTIGDNGSGEVPNDKLPKTDVPGTGKVTEPNKKPSQPVDVTTPARKTPTLELDQDPKTGDVTVTPKKPDGSTFPPGTKVEIPGKDGNPITVTIGEDGKGKVPNSDLPEGDVPGTGKITEPGKPAVEVPVETPAKVTPNTPRTEKPGKIEITRKPNGDAIVTPKKPDGSTYPSGSKVVIPGENNTPIEVTIGDNGSGEVPNDKLPKTDVPGTGKVTEPNKKPSQPVDVTTPARKTPTIELDQDPKTGDVTVTPKKPDGSTFPPGTKVEIPGKDGNPITVTIGEDGKGKVPNSDLPEGDVPGTGKITEPGKPAVEVPVETPAKVILNTPRTEKPVAPVTPDTNGDKSNDSQKVLPNTGTESNATLASLGLLGILGGLGLALGKKKED